MHLGENRVANWVEGNRYRYDYPLLEFGQSRLGILDVTLQAADDMILVLALPKVPLAVD